MPAQRFQATLEGRGVEVPFDVRAIEEAKREETRRRRVEGALEALRRR